MTQTHKNDSNVNNSDQFRPILTPNYSSLFILFFIRFRGVIWRLISVPIIIRPFFTRNHSKTLSVYISIFSLIKLSIGYDISFKNISTYKYTYRKQMSHPNSTFERFMTHPKMGHKMHKMSFLSTFAGTQLCPKYRR